MNVILVQPPFAQLNSPGPGIYYLRSFLESRGYSVSVRDHSINLFERIFCKNGLERVFAAIRERFCLGGFDPRFTSNIERFLTDEDRWLACIDRLVAFLRGEDREWGHLLALANGTLPEGIRFCRHLAENYPDGKDIPVDEAPHLASLLLADIADLITQTLDTSFSLVRYVPSTAEAFPTFRDFAAVQAGLDGYIMEKFYRPLLEEEWEHFGAVFDGEGYNEKLLLGVTIPFPGCLAGALVCADSARRHFGSRVITAAGGGYVNTELRFIKEEAFFDYFDYLSFDRGYGSLEAILTNGSGSANLYKTAFRCADGIVNNADNEPAPVDDEAARSVFPDYSGVDFSRYIRPVDDANPMHRLWSDGRWLKAYAAYGCYWHNCAFCDVSLDYIRCYKPVDVDALFRHLLAQSRASGIRGVHLVDEACPPAALLRLALLNREDGLPLVFWGNIRFEKSFTPDMAAVLASGGVIGVSAGIEIATETGLARLGKGVDLQGLVDACAAFKEAGILVHAYLIYGYWDEDAAEIIDSAETVRQFFAAGLLDSAFWHQFSLTVHSRVYAEASSGLHPALKAELLHRTAGGADSGGTPAGKKIFALNDISFEGEKRFDRFAAPLDRQLARWMQGDTASPVSSGFDFKVPEPGIAPNAVDTLLDAYARKRDRSRGLAPQEAGQVLFLGSRPLVRAVRRGKELWWRWRFADCSLPACTNRQETARAEQCAALLETAAGGTGMSAAGFFAKLQAIFADDAGQVWNSLRRQGLAAW